MSFDLDYGINYRRQSNDLNNFPVSEINLACKCDSISLLIHASRLCGHFAEALFTLNPSCWNIGSSILQLHFFSGFILMYVADG
jgi:hypothetical protein